MGALGGIITTSLTMFAQERARKSDRAISRRESLYGDFIDECSRLFSDAMGHKLDDPAKLVKLYALLSRLRLFASPSVLVAANEVMVRVLRTYEAPATDVTALINVQNGSSLDLLRGFSEICRMDLKT